MSTKKKNPQLIYIIMNIAAKNCLFLFLVYNMCIFIVIEIQLEGGGG